MGIGVKVDQRGFTLLELVVVLFVMALAAGIAAPAISRSTDSLRMRSEIAAFSAFFRQAREQAISTRRPHRVVVDPADHLVRVLVGEDVRKTRAIPERWSFDSREEKSLAVRFEPQGSSSGGEYRITADNVTWQVTIDAFTGRVKTARDDSGR